MATRRTRGDGGSGVLDTSPLTITERLPSAALGASALFAAYADGDPRALAFFAHDPWDTPARARAARAAAAHPRDRDALADALLDQNAAWWGDEEATVRTRIERLRAPESVAVVTGQQLGLFGSPLYTIYKALTAARLAAQLEAETGRPVVPVFWLADEDHDFAEVRTATVFHGPDVVRIPYDDGRDAGANRVPVGRIVLSEAVAAALDRLEAALPPSPWKAETVAALRAEWQPGVTWRDAFARTLRRLTAGAGLVFVSADDARLKRLAAPLFRKEIESWAETHAALDAVSERLVADGFHAQIAPRPVQLFLMEQDERLPLDPEAGGFRLRGTASVLPKADLLARLDAAPEAVSPGVVLRPVMQDLLFPTAAYVGGPGEVAYFAQLRPVYEAFGVPMPVLYPRASLTLVPQKVRRILDRYGLALPDLRGDLSALHRRLALERADADLAAPFAEAAAHVEAVRDALMPVATSVDASLHQAVEAARARMRKALDRLETKTVRVEKRNQRVILERLERAAAALMPGGAPQERLLAPAALLATEGDALLAQVFAAMDLDTRAHHLAVLP